MHLYNKKSLVNLLNEESFTYKTYPSLKEQLNGDLVLRPLSADDYNKGYMDLISSPKKLDLTDVEKQAQFTDFFTILKDSPGMYYPIVVEDVTKTCLIGTGMLIIEQKFIHETALRGRIENLKVYESHRRRGIGSLMLESLTVLARKLSCYKTTLNCSEELVGFCEKMGFVAEASQNFMLKTFTNNNDVQLANETKGHPVYVSCRL